MTNEIYYNTIEKIRNRKPTDLDYDIDTAYDKIALQIMVYMISNNLTIKQMAEKCDVTATTISNIIKLNHFANCYSLIKVLKAIGYELVPIQKVIK